MRKVDILIYAINSTPVPGCYFQETYDDHLRYEIITHLIYGTNKEIAREVTEKIKAPSKPGLTYTDTTGVIINRVGRLVREHKIDRKNIIVYVVKDFYDLKNFVIAKFKDNGQLDKFPMGFFDPEDDNDLINEL
jgi:hypothetical protein